MDITTFIIVLVVIGGLMLGLWFKQKKETEMDADFDDMAAKGDLEGLCHFYKKQLYWWVPLTSVMLIIFAALCLDGRAAESLVFSFVAVAYPAFRVYQLYKNLFAVKKMQKEALLEQEQLDVLPHAYDFASANEYIQWVYAEKDRLNEEKPENWPNTLYWLLDYAAEWAEQTERQSLLASMRYEQAKVLYTTSNNANARETFTLAIDLYQNMRDSDPEECDEMIALCHNYLGLMHITDQQYAEAEQEFLVAMQLNKSVLDKVPDYHKKAAVAETWFYLADLHKERGQQERAMQEAQQALTLYREATEENAEYQQDVDAVLQLIANL